MNKCFCGKDRIATSLLCTDCVTTEARYQQRIAENEQFNRDFPKCEKCGQYSWHGPLCDMCLYPNEENMAEEKKEQVNHPKHYNHGKFEVIDVIEDWDLDFHIGNVVKYVSRAGRKNDDTELQDLKKALWYLTRKIEKLENKDV